MCVLNFLRYFTPVQHLEPKKSFPTASHGVVASSTVISLANYLYDLVPFHSLLSNRDLKICPTFGKLRTLLLSEWCPGIAGDLNILSCFLKHSLILEKLTLQLCEVIYFVHDQPCVTEVDYHP